MEDTTETRGEKRKTTTAASAAAASFLAEFAPQGVVVSSVQLPFDPVGQGLEDFFEADEGLLHDAREGIRAGLFHRLEFRLVGIDLEAEVVHALHPGRAFIDSRTALPPAVYDRQSLEVDRVANLLEGCRGRPVHVGLGLVVEVPPERCEKGRQDSEQTDDDGKRAAVNVGEEARRLPARSVFRGTTKVLSSCFDRKEQCCCYQQCR